MCVLLKFLIGTVGCNKSLNVCKYLRKSPARIKLFFPHLNNFSVPNFDRNRREKQLTQCKYVIAGTAIVFALPYLYANSLCWNVILRARVCACVRVFGVGCCRNPTLLDKTPLARWTSWKPGETNTLVINHHILHFYTAFYVFMCFLYYYFVFFVPIFTVGSV